MKYILKNTSVKDVMLGDLRYKIPAGQSRDLLSPTAHLTIEEIRKSRENGSISKRLGKVLVEVEGIVFATVPPLCVVIRKAGVIKFPDRTKTSIRIEVGDISEEIENLIISEDDEFLKYLDTENIDVNSIGEHNEKAKG
jgi:hypothetical protein